MEGPNLENVNICSIIKNQFISRFRILNRPITSITYCLIYKVWHSDKSTLLAQNPQIGYCEISLHVCGLGAESLCKSEGLSVSE